jgi:hypothetical protein
MSLLHIVPRDQQAQATQAAQLVDCINTGTISYLKVVCSAHVTRPHVCTASAYSFSKEALVFKISSVLLL